MNSNVKVTEKSTIRKKKKKKKGREREEKNLKSGLVCEG
jgi:hypothetical protein